MIHKRNRRISLVAAQTENPDSPRHCQDVMMMVHKGYQRLLPLLQP
jgi:hypothetical protein